MQDLKKLKILIALDYDRSAKKVAETGFKYANSMDAEVILLHVVSDPVIYSSTEYSPMTGFTGYFNISNMPIDAENGLQKASHHFLDEFKKHYGNDNTQTIVCEGDFSEAILTTAKARHADIIMMGSHSHNWIERVVLGSVTEQVLRDTKIPVLIIPVKQ